jgi:hypothetical protein
MRSLRSAQAPDLHSSDDRRHYLHAEARRQTEALGCASPIAKVSKRPAPMPSSRPNFVAEGGYLSGYVLERTTGNR